MNYEFSHIDWKKRLQIGSTQKELAKFLQTYIASHNKQKPHRVSIKLIKQLSGSTTLTRKFKHHLKEALAELERLEIINNVRFEEDLVTWQRM